MRIVIGLRLPRLKFWDLNANLEGLVQETCVSLTGHKNGPNMCCEKGTGSTYAN